MVSRKGGQPLATATALAAGELLAFVAGPGMAVIQAHGEPITQDVGFAGGQIRGMDGDGFEVGNLRYIVHGFDEGRAAALDQIGFEAALKLGEQVLIAPQPARIEQAGEDGDIGFGEADAFAHRAGRMADRA